MKSLWLALLFALLGLAPAQAQSFTMPPPAGVFLGGCVANTAAPSVLLTAPYFLSCDGSGNLRVNVVSGGSAWLNTNKVITWDGTNQVTYKPASTAALATDTSEVIQLNPNSPGIIALGQTTKSASIPVTIASDQLGGAATTNSLSVNESSQYPANAIGAAVPITAASGNVAATAAIATLAAAASKTTYISGFEISGSGATLGSCVTVTVVGTITGTLSYTYCAAAGVLVSDAPLVVPFVPAIPASAVNTAIVVTLPSLGTGNTNATVVAHGYQL